MNPIKAHLLDRLRPKDRTMRNDADIDVYQLGKRACRAGMNPQPGIATLGEDATVGFWDTGVIIGFGHQDKPETSKGYLLSWGGELVPDFRDPGTKGHAVAQLRERKKDPELCTRATRGVDDEGAPCLFWSIESATHYNLGELPFYLTEEEAIVAAFEAIKETP